MPDRDTADLLLERLRGLAPIVEEHRKAIDAERRLPAPLFTALAEAGLFRLWLPRALDGPELSPLEFMEVVETATALDASVGWIVGNGGGASRVAGYLPEAAARRLFADPRAFLVLATGAVGRAVPVQGGYRVTGRWPYGSGIHGATGVAGLCAVATPGQEGAAPTLMAIAPIEAAAVIDTWQVSGLKGTGSCDFTLQDVFVPADHVFGYPDQRAVMPGLVYRLPVVSSFSWSVSVVPLAIARAILEDAAGLMRDRMRVGTSVALRERESIQSEVGRAEAILRAARALMIEAMLALMAAVERGETALIPRRADLRLATAYAADSALRAAAMLEAAVGAVAIQEGGPLARRLRDLRAAVQHVAMSPNSFIVAGRLRLGLDAGTMRI